ncbi:SusC/RagA family TonB-linked outer membrane protein [Bacteroidia bacterium]|nr:SusC/RagA family TonB-linked outer membrane protein [Bacteroidia bacterium]
MKKKTRNKKFAKLVKVLLLSSILLGGGGQSICAETPQEAAQNLSVRGTITDTNGEPLVGVSVTIKGTSRGTVSDLDGNYSLTVPDEKSQLGFSYIGYSAQTIPVGTQRVINVRLEEDILTLEETVVIGYGSTRKQDLSMAVTTVKIDQAMKSRPGAGVASMLQGKVPGMTVTQNGGEGGHTIMIRGKGSRDDDGVLTVVDGIPGAGYTIDDVETVTILKDAASAAIYGAQVGAGGVILITTKQAKAGKMKVDAHATYGIRYVPKLPKVVTAEQYMQMWSDVVAASTTTYSLGPAQDKYAYPYGNVTRTDWLDEIFRTGTSQHYSLSLSGGSEAIKVLNSVEYNKNEGIMLNTHSHSINGKLQVDFTPAKWLKISERATYGYGNWQGEVGNSGHQGVLNTAIFYPRSATVYEYNPDGTVAIDANGQPRWGGIVPQLNPQNGVGSGYGNLSNPVATLMRMRQEHPNQGLTSTTGLDIKPFSSLTLHSDFTASASSSRNENFKPLVYELGAAGDPSNEREVNSNWSTNWLWESTISYAEVFGEHHVSALAGYTMRYGMGRNSGARTYQFDNESDHYTLLGNGQTIASSKPWEGKSEESLYSVMGRVGYSWNDRYFLTGSVRRDATSKLYKDYNSGVFPAFSASWKLSSEPFFPQTDFVNLVKVRGGWGQIGNINTVGNYSYVAGLSNVTDGSVGGVVQPSGMYVNTIPNLQLTWETTEQTSLGLDLTFLNNTLDITVDYFDKLTKDLIDEVPIPPAAGIDNSPRGNLGRVSNEGVEFGAGYHNSIGEVNYNVNAVLSTVKSKVLEFYNGKVYSHGDFGNSGPQPLRSQQGQPWWSYQLIKTDGIFQNQEEIDNYVKNGEKIQPNARPGDLKFVDFNGDGTINDDDRQFMGSYLPELTYSFGCGVEWKGLDVNVYFQGINKVKIFNGMKTMVLSGRSAGHYFLADALDNWMYDHSSKNPNPALFEDPNNNYKTASDYFLEDGSYLRLKNVTIGYTFPKNVLQQAGMGSVSLRLYASAENVFTITKYSGFDPEIGGHGIDGGVYPIARAFNFGLNINF